jgi:Holliday junction resolvase
MTRIYLQLFYQSPAPNSHHNNQPSSHLFSNTAVVSIQNQPPASHQQPQQPIHHHSSMSSRARTRRSGRISNRGGQHERLAGEQRFVVSEVQHVKLARRLKLVIAGRPCSLQRPKFRCAHVNGHRNTRQGRVTIWNPSDEDQELMRQCIEGAIRPRLDAAGRPLFFQSKTSLSVDLVFYMPRPNCHFQAGTERLFENVCLQYRTTDYIRTPDIDNLVKFVLDKPLEGIVYGNDSHITGIRARKTFDNVGDCSGRISIDVASAPVSFPIDVDNLPKWIQQQQGASRIDLHYLHINSRKSYKKRLSTLGAVLLNRST